MIDKTAIIVTYGRELDKSQLLRYGTVLNDLPRLNMLFLRVTDDVLAQIKSVRGVVRVAYNEVHPANILHAAPSPFTAQENWKIYEEMNLAPAHAITMGDPRVRIATIDSGLSSDHNDINVIGGGRFSSGVYHADNGLPMKVKLYELVTASRMGIMNAASVFTHDVNRAKNGGTVPATAYADSTCKTALFAGAIPNQYLFDSNFSFWINAPVDIRLEDEEYSYWHTGLGRTTIYDIYGHGTAVAGIISDIAPGCTTVSFKLANDLGNIETIDILACLDYLTTQDFHIISTSWGGPTDAERTAAYNALVATGVLWTCSAGNSGEKPDTDVATDPYLYPGAIPGVFCVGACGQNNAENTDTGFIDSQPDLIDYTRLTYFSQKHNRVAIVAPGFGYQVHYPLNYNYGAFIPEFKEFGRNYSLRRYSSQRSGGTSWAQPAVAASAGLLMSKIISGYQTTDPAEVRGILLSNVAAIKSAFTTTAKATVKLSNGNPATVGYGAGRIDVGAAIGLV